MILDRYYVVRQTRVCGYSQYLTDLAEAGWDCAIANAEQFRTLRMAKIAVECLNRFGANSAHVALVVVERGWWWHRGFDEAGEFAGLEWLETKDSADTFRPNVTRFRRTRITRVRGTG